MPVFEQSLQVVVRVVLAGGLGLCYVLILVRCVGLRSFSKMTSVDFIVTVACGSLLAQLATAPDWQSGLAAAAALGVLLGFQYCFALVRRTDERLAAVIENEPALLFEEGEFLEDELRRTRVRRQDVFAKLREANAAELGQVRAVVLETTGDISVLHGDSLDRRVLTGVRRTGDQPPSTVDLS